MVKIENLVACVKVEDCSEEENEVKTLDPTGAAARSVPKIEANSPEIAGSIEHEFNPVGSMEKKPFMDCIDQQSDILSAASSNREAIVLGAPLHSDPHIKIEAANWEEFDAFTEPSTSFVSSHEVVESKPDSDFHCNDSKVTIPMKKEFEPQPLIKLVKVEGDSIQSDELSRNKFLEEGPNNRRLRLNSSDFQLCQDVLEHTNRNSAFPNSSLKTPVKSLFGLSKDEVKFDGLSSNLTLDDSTCQSKMSACAPPDSKVLSHKQSLNTNPEHKLTQKSDILAWKANGKKTSNRMMLLDNKVDDEIPVVDAFNDACSDDATRTRLKFRCERCKRPFARKEFVKRHIQYHCGGPPLMTKNIDSSQEGGFGYSNRGLHRVDNVKEERPQCKECGKFYSRQDVLLKHMRKGHLQRRKNARKKSHVEAVRVVLTCDDCQKTFSSKIRLQTHLLYHRRQSQQLKFGRICGTCNASFSDSYSFNRHMRWAHRHDTPRDWAKTSRNGIEALRDGNHQCKGCGTLFTRRSDVTKHLKRPGLRNVEFSVLAEIAGTDPSTCPYCEKSFSSEEFLKCHLLRRLKNPREVCQLCCEFFEDTMKRDEHYRMVHRTSVGKVHDLSMVNKKSKNSARLVSESISGQSSKSQTVIKKKLDDSVLKHETSQKREKRSLHSRKFKNPVYSCHSCGKSFQTKGWLSNHIQRKCLFQN